MKVTHRADPQWSTRALNLRTPEFFDPGVIAISDTTTMSNTCAWAWHESALRQLGGVAAAARLGVRPVRGGASTLGVKQST